MWDQYLSKLDHATTPQKAVSLWHNEITPGGGSKNNMLAKLRNAIEQPLQLKIKF